MWHADNWSFNFFKFYFWSSTTSIISKETFCVFQTDQPQD